MDILFLLILLFCILYYIGPTLLRWGIRYLMGRAISHAQRQAQYTQHNQKKATQKSSSSDKKASSMQGDKIFKKNEGEYVDFEEIP